MHQVKNAYDILEMPTAWGNGVTCDGLNPACPSRDERKSPITFLELLIPLLCKELSVLGCSVCRGTGWPGGSGLEAHEGDPSCDESSYPSSIPSWKKGDWKAPLSYLCQTWELIPGCSTQERKALTKSKRLKSVFTFAPRLSP